MICDTQGERKTGRVEKDFYETPGWVTAALLRRESFDGVSLEPACGKGAIAKMLPGSVIASDIADRGFGTPGVNFLTSEIPGVDNVITNPPYNVATEFVLRSIMIARSKVAMLLNVVFVEGQKRYRDLFKANPPSRVYFIPKRIDFGNGRDNPFCSAWFVWDKAHAGPTTLHWIDVSEL